MPFNGQIRFERFAENGAVPSEDDEGQEIFKEWQEQSKSYNDTVTSSNLPLDHKQNNLVQLCTSRNESRSLTCRFTLCLVFAALLVFSIVLALVLLVSFIVKCDESKMIKHYEERKSSMEMAFSSYLADSWQQGESQIEENYRSQKIRWIRFNFFDTKLMEKLEPAGLERRQERNLLMFVARTQYLNGTVVGKYCPFFRKMFFGYEGKEEDTRSFEVLSYPAGALSWVPAKKDKMPGNDSFVLGGGAPVNGESTFICRMKHDSHLVIGKYLAASGGCLAAYRHDEFHQESFELLVINEMGRILGVES